jgi:Na+/H+-dicarboxylate symporter
VSTAPAPRRRLSPAAWSVIALVAGLGVGLIIDIVDVAPLRFVAAVLEPIGTIWVNGIRMTVIPLVVALIITGVAGSAEVRLVGRLGVRAVATFTAILVGTATFTFLLAPLVYSWLHVDPATTASLRASIGAPPTTIPTARDWLLSLVPTNPLKSAADGAMLPVIIFTALFAMAVTRLDAALRDGIVQFFRAIADAMLVIVRWVLAAAPIGVFALAVTLATKVGTSAAGAVGYFIVAHSVLLVGAILLLYPVAVLVGRVALPRFVKACLPAQTVAATTRSSLAALPAMIEGAERTLGMRTEVAGFVLPFAVSTFRLNQAVSWGACAIFVAALYGVPLPPAQLAFLLAASVPMSFSVPGIPSGGVVMMTPFFIAAGLPAEGIGILIAADAIPDVFKTALNVTGQMTATAVVGRDA